jgi:hypothetical protein|tara:strand:- start:17187 stop:17651 length:465 start_codon:yes stop_codon:yes gene_type:complete
MAHFAKVDESNNVLAVLTMGDKDMLNDQGVEDESVGQHYLEKHNNWPAHLWIQTSYNTHRNKHTSGDDSKALRGNFAVRGGTWDPVNEIFMKPKRFSSFVLDLENAIWVSPAGPRPELTLEQARELRNYYWDDPNQQWALTPADPGGPYDQEFD